MKRLWQFLCRLKSVFALLFWMGGLGLACATPPPDLSVDTLRSQTGTFPYDTVPMTLEDMNPSSKTFGTLQ